MFRQYTKTKTLHINSFNETEAINLAKIVAPNQLFLRKRITEEFDFNKSTPYPKLPQPYQLNNNDHLNTNNTYGYNIELTKIVWGEETKEQKQTREQKYIITNCKQHEKPYLYAHAELNKCSTMKLPLYIYAQKNRKVIFRAENILSYIKDKYDYKDENDESLFHLINSSIDTTAITNIDIPYEVVLVRNIPNKGQQYFGILLISDQNNKIIINEKMKKFIEENQFLQNIIIEYNYKLLNNKIQSNTYNKKTLKI